MFFKEAQFELGHLIPSDHGISVSLARWQDVIDYENGNPDTLRAMQGGYPRFFLDKRYRELCQAYTDPNSENIVFAFPSLVAAQKCIEFVRAGRAVMADHGIALAILPTELAREGKLFWQHTGLIISARQAEAILNGKSPPASNRYAKSLKKILGSLMDVVPGDVFLYPTGMSAIFEAYESVRHLGGPKTIQLGFPYVDTWKIQQKFGEGAEYIPYNTPADLDNVRLCAEKGGVSAVFCEIPGNPLLRTVDLKALSDILRPLRIPLIIDDTLGMPMNVDVMPYADIIVTSLTKSFSGVGNVMGGSLILNPSSSHYSDLKSFLQHNHEELLFVDDAKVLLRNCHDYVSRMEVVNANAVRLADFLRANPLIDQVYFPKSDPSYEAIKKVGGGYGGLLSFTLKNPSLAPMVYDNLEVARGPSLGTNFTLASPYTLLAHYGELVWANSQGVATNLIRVSVGLENIDEIIGRFDYALRMAQVPKLVHPEAAPDHQIK